MKVRWRSLVAALALAVMLIAGFRARQALTSDGTPISREGCNGPGQKETLLAEAISQPIPPNWLGVRLGSADSQALRKTVQVAAIDSELARGLSPVALRVPHGVLNHALAECIDCSGQGTVRWWRERILRSDRCLTFSMWERLDSQVLCVYYNVLPSSSSCGTQGCTEHGVL